jgi:putative peptide zinc metalloprotease protein
MLMALEPARRMMHASDDRDANKIHTHASGQDGVAGLWRRLAVRENGAKVASEAPNVWMTVEERLDVTRLRPERIIEWELAEVGGKTGEKRYVLKNRRNGAYLQMTEPDVMLWNLMDGTHTVKQLVIEMFVDRKRYAPDHVVRLVALLRRNGFLEARHTPVLESLSQRLLGRRWTARLRGVGQFFTNTKIVIPHADGHFTAVYNRVGWLFFTPVGLVIGGLLFLADIVLFPYVLFRQEFQLLAVQGHYQWSLLTLATMLVFTILIHEYAHASTSKHFGREVNRAGFMLIFGVPAFFVDTTDMWMTRKWPRIAVSWAGPYINMMLGGLSLLLLTVAPPTWPRDLIWAFATMNTLGGLWQLLPITHSDGDYILMDLLEVPQLRSRAFAFLRRDVWQKLKQRERFNKLDAILGGYGVLAVGGIIYTIAVAVRLWLTNGVALFQSMLANPLFVAQIVAPVLAVAAIVYILRFGMYRIRRVDHRRVVQERLERK